MPLRRSFPPLRPLALVALFGSACGPAPAPPGTTGAGEGGAGEGGALEGSGGGGAERGGAGGAGVGGAGGAEPSVSRCAIEGDAIRCEEQSLTLIAHGEARLVRYQVPLGDPPASGWPGAIVFQGSFYPVNFEATEGEPLGMYHQTRLLQVLLDAGYAVVAPEARGGGSTYWDTNVPPWSTSWESAPDHALVLALLDALEAGSFGPLDPGRLFATGISSGGYMTSRMAVSYAGRFRALAVHSASYATCGGSFCSVPQDLPDDHPPTLFLHGEKDTVVPVSTMRAYKNRLSAEGIAVDEVVRADTGHAWLPEAPEAIVAFFDAHP